MSNAFGALGRLQDASGLGSNDRAMEQMRRTSEETMEFQTMLLELQRGQSTFNMIVNAKQDAMKCMSDIAKEGIRKSAA